MKKKLFTIYFSTGSVIGREGTTPLEAAILAQANAIELDYSSIEIERIENEETGEIFRIEQKVEDIKGG